MQDPRLYLMNRRFDDDLVRELSVASESAELNGRRLTVIDVEQDRRTSPNTKRSDRALMIQRTSRDMSVVFAETLASPLPVPVSDDEARRLATAVYRDHCQRQRREALLPERLIAFFEALSAATSERAIQEVVEKHVLLLVGGYRARVELYQAGEACRRPTGEGLNFPGDPPRDSRIPGDLLQGGEVQMLAHVPLDRRGVLWIAERRGERIFQPGDWELLRSIARQCVSALDRLQILEEARSASLTDPLTGLANRRQMDIVLSHAWAGAQRGTPLTVVLIDLDDFKQINDRCGHAVGDDILREVGASLRQEARGADCVVRLGGDEFLAILPGSQAPGGTALVRRLGERLDGLVGFSVGMASYGPCHGTPEALIRSADDDLYARKAARRRPT